MAKIDIISGFLGAGKTTLIKKLVADAFQGEKLVIIENEFGEIGIDGGFLKESGIQITEMNSGCICCSLVGDFGNALKDVLEKYSPDRVIIEPSGVGKLSDVIKAVKNIGDDVKINSTATVVDASKCKMYMKNYGEFYNNQIESAGTIILSRTQNVSEEKLAKVLTMIKEKNDEASVITTPWDQIDGKKILDAMEKVNTLEKELLEEHHHHDGECGCGHEHHHHDHDVECGCGHEHHHHDMTKSVAADMSTIITTMTENVAADTTMNMAIIMQMMCLQAGVLRQLTSLQRKNLRILYQNLQVISHLVMFSVLRELLLQMRVNGSTSTLYLRRLSLEEVPQIIQEEYA